MVDGARVAGHVGRFAPFGELGFGIDHSTINTFPVDYDADVKPSGGGFGMHLGFGLDVAVTKHIGVGLLTTIHPGFTAFAIVDDENLAFEGADVAYFAVDAVVNAYF